jgi:beta-aspartyl-dipeptidase (metallo-type)
VVESDTTLTLIRGGRCFAPAELGRKDVRLGYGKILAIEDDARRFAAFGSIQTIDASEKLVVPGFIDQHLHFLGGGDFEGPLGRVPELHVSMITRGGVTTAVGIMGIDMDGKNLHALLIKANELQRSGLTTYIYTGSFRIPSPYLTTSVRADITLIDKVLGVKVAVSEDTYPNLSLPEFARVAGEVRLTAGISGKTAVIHAHIGRNETRLQPIFDLLKTVNLAITQIVPTHVNRHRPKTLEHAIEFARLGGTIDFSANLSKRSGSLTGMNPPSRRRWPPAFLYCRSLCPRTPTSRCQCGTPMTNRAVLGLLTAGVPISSSRSRPASSSWSKRSISTGARCQA